MASCTVATPAAASWSITSCGARGMLRTQTVFIMVVLVSVAFDVGALYHRAPTGNFGGHQLARLRRAQRVGLGVHLAQLLRDLRRVDGRDELLVQAVDDGLGRAGLHRHRVPR